MKSFYMWLRKQADRDEPIGDLASDMKRSIKHYGSIPPNSNDYHDWRRYFPASSWVQDAFHEAWREYCHVYKRHNKKRQEKINKGLTLRFFVLHRDGYKCQACGRSVKEDGIKLEVDHIHPKSRGGSNDARNLQALCFECNRGKRDKVLNADPV